MKAETWASALRVPALALSILAVGCREVPVETAQSKPPVEQPVDSLQEQTGLRFVAAECRANVRQLKVECGVPATVPGVSHDIIVGGQNHYVALTSSNVNYAGGSFTFDVTIRNLIPQPIGTTDDVTLTPAAGGIKIFFHNVPTVTSGTGSITVVADGTGTFTNSDQPYYQYNTVLERFEVSTPKGWRFDMPPEVNTFSFTVLVSAPVPWPDGYIDVTGPREMRYDARQFAATVRNAVGDPVPDMSITWSSSDTTMAAVTAAGIAVPKRAGLVRVIASATLNGLPVTGDTVATVQPIRRMWTGAAGTTNWLDNNNWHPAIAPVSTDTAIVSDSVATVFPVFTQNHSIGGLLVEDRVADGLVPTVNIGPFNLTASGNVHTTGNSSITGTSGILSLTANGGTLSGNLPMIRVTGRYSLTGNLNVKPPLRTELGLITNYSYRISASN